MSFILDALKKSENARQRQAGPALFEVKVVPPRRTLPVWVLVAGILLLLYGVVLSWMLLRPRSGPPRPVTRAPHTATAPAARAAVAAVRRSPQIPAATSTTKVAGPGPTSAPTARAGPATPAQPIGTAQHSTPNPADLVPAAQPRDAGAGAASDQGLPLYPQIAATPGADLPRLHLDLHVYDSNPAKRFVMINMHKLRQGNSLADGVTVVKIRPDGVVLSYQGRKFLLPR